MILVVHGGQESASVDYSVVIVVGRHHLEVVLKLAQRPQSCSYPQRPVGSAFVKVATELLEVVNYASMALVASVG